MKWFRFYHEALDDPKVQLLEPEIYRAWVNCLCLAAKNKGKLPSIESVSFALRCTVSCAEKLLEKLHQENLLDKKENSYEPHNWRKRQYISDTSTLRVKRFRKRYKNTIKTASVTSPEQNRTDTETDTEKKHILDQSSITNSESARKEKSRARSTGTKLPIDWKPNDQHYERGLKLGMNSRQVDEQAEIMREWAGANANRQIARKANWDLTFHGFLRRAKHAKHGNGSSQHPLKGAAAVSAAMDSLRDKLGLRDDGGRQTEIFSADGDKIRERRDNGD